MSIRPSAAYSPRPAAAPSPAAAAPGLAPGDHAKIRYQTLSPVQEYAARAGQTEALDEEFHAVLTNDWRGSGTVTAAGITIKAAALVGPARASEGAIYWHPDSDLCNRVAAGPLAVHYTFNPARPEVVHLWSLDWKYLETLPRKERAAFLDNTALAAAARDHKRQIKRFTDHAQLLHQGDTARALDALAHNASAMDRVAVDLPLPAGSRPAARAEDAAAGPPSGFAAARRGAVDVAEERLQINRLAGEAAADFHAIEQKRRPAAPAFAAYDPLDEL